MHTPEEWATQLIANVIDPIGEIRGDKRSAAQAVQIVRGIRSGDPIPLQEIGECAEHYLAFNQPADERVLLPDEEE